MADLRTLVARALQDTDYVPAVSARIRAVPDTRTIRYYTTLGLMDRPAEMRGRTAYYDAKHVMQLVAIKRLQAKNETLSDIQFQLTALSPKQLQSLAALPSDFWRQAEKYLREPRAETTLPQSDSVTETNDEFWAQAAALPSEIPHPQTPRRQSSGTQVSQQLRIALHPQVRLHIDTSIGAEAVDAASLRRLQSAANSLIKELARQNLIAASPTTRPDARS